MSNDLDNGYAVLQTSCIANDVEGKKGCNSSDALTIYEHEGEEGVWYDSYCYSCNQFFNKEQTHNSQAAIELGIKDGEVVEKKKFNPLPKSQPLKKEEVIEFIKKIGYEGKNYRSLKDEYNKFYGHLTKLDSTGKPIARYYPETKDGVVVGYKCRNFPKNFSHGKLGVTGISNDMSGQVKFKSGGRYVLIVGGESDKVAAYQMLREDQITRKQGEYEATAVVSPTTGEPSAYKQVASNYEFFDSFDIIVVGMDSDEKGTEAAYAVAKMLPSDKVRIAKWSSKDPNKMLEEGKQKQFVRDFYNAKPFVSVGIKSAADAMSEVSDFLNSPKIGLPPHLHRLQENMRGGIKSTGAIVNIIGHTSIGKCLGKDTPILMYDFSIKKVQEVGVGDLIMGDDGTPRKVMSLANGTELMYKVEQEKGITYTVNSSHILSLRAGFDTPQYKKGEIVNINVEDYINSSKTNKRSLKGYKGDFRKYNVTQQEESKAYLLGLWLAEGTEVASEVTIHKEMFEILQEEAYNAGYSITIKKEYNLCITCYIKGGFKAWLRSIGVLGKKHFPSYLMQCTPNTRYNAIAGYLDGDGFKVSNGYEVTAKQDLLSSTFMELCKSVSLQVTNRKVEKSCQNNFSGIYNRMFVFGKTNEIPNKLTRKKVDTKSKLREHNNTKITVTKLKEDEYFGFVIDGNHLFCLGDGTVTHNTLFTDTLIYDWVFNSPVMPTILSLERTAGELLIDLYSLHLKKNLTWFSDGQDAIDYLDTPEVKVLCENLVYKEDGTPRFYIIDERSASVETLKKQVDKTRKQNNSNFIICDPLTDFLRSLPLEDQENFMMYQKLLKKDGVVFINVLHTRKPSSDKEGKARDVSEYDVLGSGSFVQSADINIVLNRDKMAENPTERNTTYVSMPKCRGGTTGLACKIYYDPETRQVYDYDDRFNTTPEVSIIVDEDGEDIQIQF